MADQKPGRICQICSTDIGRKYKCPICGEDNRNERSQKDLDSLVFYTQSGTASGSRSRDITVAALRPKPPGYCDTFGHSLKPTYRYSISRGTEGGWECVNCHSTWNQLTLRPQIVTTGRFRKRDHIAWTILLEGENPSVLGSVEVIKT